MFGTGIAKLEWLEEELPWLLKDSKGQNLGRFHGLVASDKNIVSPRFTGLPPPLGKTSLSYSLLLLLPAVSLISTFFLHADLNLVPELATKLLQHIPVLPCFSLMLAFKEPLSLVRFLLLLLIQRVTNLLDKVFEFICISSALSIIPGHRYQRKAYLSRILRF